MKRCPKCGVEKSVDEFGKNSGSRDGRTTYCLPCARQTGKDSYQARMLRDPDGQRAKTRRSLSTYRERYPDRVRESQREWYENGGREWTLRRARERLYGLTVEDYQRLLILQGGVCAICQRPERRRNRAGEIRELCVDHDHATGAVRGLLCTDCNQALGLFEDDTRRLIEAVSYLRRNGSP